MQAAFPLLTLPLGRNMIVQQQGEGSGTIRAIRATRWLVSLDSL